MPLARLFDDDAGFKRAKVACLLALLVAANAAAWTWAILEFSASPVLLGTAFLAYSFGLRHAVDIDHIAAIDNVVRKLMQEGLRPLSVGLFFSLGHSTVVVLATLAIAATATANESRFEPLKEVGGFIGTTVSALFLLAIGIVNLMILLRIWRSFLHVRRGGELEPEHLDVLLAGRGFLAALFRRLFRIISRSWHMYPLGFLFGVGFDTATEIGLLAISATQAAQGMSPWSMLIFPALFTAGMVLVDTIDGVFMVEAYGWAFANPIRKLWYNLTITAVSVLTAVLIGSIEALGLLAERLQLRGGLWTVARDLNDSLGTFGFVIIAAFAGCWVLSALIYRWKGLAEIATAAAIAPKP